MVDPKFEEFYKKFVGSKQQRENEFSSIIKSHCDILKRQKSELENCLGDGTNNSLFANINLNDLTEISKQLENNEDFTKYENSEFKLPLKQKLLKVLSKLDSQKIANIQSGLENFRQKINILKVLFTTYKSIENNDQINEVSLLEKLAFIHNRMKEFSIEDLQTKIFKHLRKKMDFYHDLQMKKFQTKTIQQLYEINNDSIIFHHEKIENFFKNVPKEFQEFETFFMMKIQGSLLEKIKTSIFQDSVEIALLKPESEKNETNDSLPFSKLKFEKSQLFFPKEENTFEEYFSSIEEFFRIFFENITILNKFPLHDVKTQKDYFITQMLDFLKTLNMKILDKQNRFKLTQKIKELEVNYKSHDYFNRDFHTFFENIQNTEIFESSKANLLEFKNSLCGIFKKIKNDPFQKSNYLEIFEKVKLQIESLEKLYYFFEIETAKDAESTQNDNKIYFLFLGYFSLILELMKIFEEEMNQINSLFYHSWISLLNLTQTGVNKFAGVLIAELKIKDRNLLNSLYNLNKIMANLDLQYRTKLEIEEIALH